MATPSAVPLHVLVVEDAPEHVELIRRGLEGSERRVRISVATDLASYRAAASSDPPDVVLMDLSLPDGNGLQALTPPPEYGPHPIIVLTALRDERAGIDAVRAGAMDYVVKSEDAFASLPRTIDGALRQWQHIVARRMAEDELRRLNAELEERVAERTARLEKALAKLQEAMQELDAFSYSVAHDLRGPARRMYQYAESLLQDREGHLPADARRILERIREGGRQMCELVDDLLALSQVSRREIARADVPVSLLCEQIIARLHQGEPQRVVEARITPDLHAHADPRLTLYLLENLLGNAWKYTAQSNPSVIEVGVAAGDDGPFFYVRDNGCGFDMKYADKLFQPFQRLVSSDEYHGTGIGLAICQRIVSRHGGRIWADAREGAGATFYFTLGPGPRSNP